MSVFDGEIEFRSIYMVDYPKKIIPFPPRVKPDDDNCLIAGVARDALKAREAPRQLPDVLCPLTSEYYKEEVKRVAQKHPTLAKMYMSEDIDPVPIDHDIQDSKRSEYLNKYCSRELPFMSVNLARRARALQTLHLPDDVFIPDTTQRSSYRHPAPEKYKEHPKSLSFRPKYDDSLRQKLRQIQRIRTGDTVYQSEHSLLGSVLLEKNPYGPAREEPKYGVWKNPYYYTYRIN